MSYTAEIEKLEDYLYERKVPAIFMDLWFDLKKDTARIERYFGRQTYSINEFQKWAEKQADFPLLDLTTFDQDVKFALSNTGAALSRLDSHQKCNESQRRNSLGHSSHATIRR